MSKTLRRISRLAVTGLKPPGDWYNRDDIIAYIEISIDWSWLGLNCLQVLQVAHQAVLDLLLQLAESQEHTEASCSLVSLNVSQVTMKGIEDESEGGKLRAKGVPLLFMPSLSPSHQLPERPPRDFDASSLPHKPL